MNAVFRFLACVLALAAAIAIAPNRAHAQNITCSATMTNVAFGTVNPLSSQTDANATLNYSCTNSSTSATRYATVCFSIGDGAQGGGNANPRRMQDGSGNPLYFQLWQNASRTTVWGSSFFGVNTPVDVDLTIARRATVTGSATMYAASSTDRRPPFRARIRISSPATTPRSRSTRAARARQEAARPRSSRSFRSR